MSAGRRSNAARWVAWSFVLLFVAGSWALAGGIGAFHRGGLTEAEIAERGGSAEPCEIPLGWYIGEIDARFGIDRAAAEAAARRAVGYWETATSPDLLPHDPVDGIPIHFRYDDRQQTAAARREAAAELADLDRRLDVRRAELEQAFDRLDQELVRHNAQISDWNERGGAPPDVAESLQRSADQIEARRQALDGRATRLNLEVDERNRRWERLQDEFPERRVESGHYGEQVRIRNGRVSEVFDREILIWYFNDPAELPPLIAHELGHALGLGHVERPGAVMSRVQSADLSALHPADLQMLARICPALVGD